VFLLCPVASAGGHKVKKYRYSVVDMPISLAKGKVRTPVFPVVSGWYDIMVQIAKPRSIQGMEKIDCMMGVTAGPLDSKGCSGDDPLLRANWTVWDGGKMVDHGSSTTYGDAKWENKYIYKFLGDFVGEVGKKYVVEVKFIKDGTPLNLANPHLIVIQHKDN
jgi:hypothetical protein